MKHSGSILVLLFLFSTFGIGLQAQETKRNDTIRGRMQETPSRIGSQQTDSTKSGAAKAIFEKQLAPVLPPQYRMQSFSDINSGKSLPSAVSIRGYGRNEFNNAERTAVFTFQPAANLSFYTAGTLGVYKTLPHGNINYYNLDFGTAFTLSPTLNANAGVFYSSSMEMPLSMRGTYLNVHHRATDRLQLNGGVSYTNLQAPYANLSQHSVMLNTHIRYQLAEDWFINGYGGLPALPNAGNANTPMHPMMPRTYYGGTVEYWFQPQMGVEGGVIWQQDMFGKMRPTTKFEIKFGDRRK